MGYKKVSKKDKSSVVVVEGLAELINRLTPEEKRELVRTINWPELDKLREEAKCIKHQAAFGDPKVYIERTDEGLNEQYEWYIDRSGEIGN